VWRYKFPQHCGVAVARISVREDEPLPLPRPVGLREQPDIPAAIMPKMTAPTLNPPPDAWDEEMFHALGIEELRKKMR
jgi:hypothetical protein